MARIYTKTGDKGTTSLVDSSRVSKDDLRVHVLGTLDEVNAHIGSIIVLLPRKHATRLLLLKTQSVLFTCGSRLAEPREESVLGLKMPDDELIQEYEQAIDTLSRELAPLAQFILPGGTELASRTHVARAVARRAERLIVSLRQEGEFVEPGVLQYMNRLSDWLFTLARYYNFEADCEELVWESHSDNT